jgi:hypothetical protein
VARGDKPDSGFIVEAVEQMIKLYARQAKYDTDTFAVKRLCECLTTGHLGHSFSFLYIQTVVGKHSMVLIPHSAWGSRIPLPRKDVNPEYGRTVTATRAALLKR